VKAERGELPDAVFPTFTDLSVFTERPLRPLPETLVSSITGNLLRSGKIALLLLT
jgi:hypothetical protein